MPVGLFGKYPAKRDFLALNLPKGVVTVLETWLQKAVAISRERLGRQWLSYYSVHPIWNFRLGEEIAGADCLGALMPSVDGVGRYFPLCLVAHAPPGLSFPLFEEISGEWIEALNARLLSVLAEGEGPEPEALMAGLEDPLAATTGQGVESIPAAIGRPCLKGRRHSRASQRWKCARRRAGAACSGRAAANMCRRSFSPRKGCPIRRSMAI